MEKKIGEGDDAQKETAVGDAEIIANDIYYNLSDVEQLKDIVGTRSALFTKEGFKKALIVLQGKYEWQEDESTQM